MQQLGCAGRGERASLSSVLSIGNLQTSPQHACKDRTREPTKAPMVPRTAKPLLLAFSRWSLFRALAYTPGLPGRGVSWVPDSMACCDTVSFHTAYVVSVLTLLSPPQLLCLPESSYRLLDDPWQLWGWCGQGGSGVDIHRGNLSAQGWCKGSSMCLLPGMGLGVLVQ